MTGYHIVAEFRILRDGQELSLPEGWKPFAFDPHNQTVICRKWIRKEKNSSDS